MFLHTLRLCLSLTLVSAGSAAFAAEMLPGPYQGTVERVVDGDTLAVRVRVWLQQDLSVLVRLRGVDAPELRGRCVSEKARAAEAAAELAELVKGGAVVLTRVEGDKYFGRVVADVVTPDGSDLSRALLAGGNARRYDGRARQGWCEIGATEAGGSEVAQVD